MQPAPAQQRLQPSCRCHLHHHQQHHHHHHLTAAARRSSSRRGRAAGAAHVEVTSTAQGELAGFEVESFGFRQGFDYDFDRGPMLGSGTFGVVHACRHVRSGLTYAVKSIPKVWDAEGGGYTLDAAFVSRVFHEVDIARQLGQSLNVIHMVEAYEDDVNVDLVMELASGGSLWDRIQQGPAPEAEAAGYVADMLRAVAQCHAKGVVVRDVKPDNYLFTSRRPGAPLKMVDFGLAQPATPGTVFTERAGTPFYCSPEVITQAGYSFPTDVWSVGVATYQLLAGRLPWANDSDWVEELAGAGGRLSGFGASTVARLVGPGGPNIPSGVLWRAIIGAELDFSWPPWDALSGGARDIVAAMLTRDPAARPSAAELLHHPWLARHGACVGCWRASGGAADCAACADDALGKAPAISSSPSSSSDDADDAASRPARRAAQQQRRAAQQQQDALEILAVTPQPAAASDSASSTSTTPQQQQQQQPLYLQPLEDSLVQRLQRYGTFPRLKQLALRQVVSLMAPPPPCVAAYAAAFERLDAAAGGSGRLPAARLAELLGSELWDLSEVEVNMLVSQFDLDHDGCVSMPEWLSALVDWPLAQQHPLWPEWLRAVFDAFDGDGDGFISPAELLLQLGSSGSSGGDGDGNGSSGGGGGGRAWSELDGSLDEESDEASALGRRAVRAALRHADANHDGRLSFDEFSALVETSATDQLDLFPSRRVAGVNVEVPAAT